MYPAFVSGLPESERGRFADAATATAALEELYRVARLAWPDIEIDRDVFATEVGKRLDGELEHIRAPDVYLAIACCAGNEPAIEEMIRTLQRESEFAATRTTATRDQIAEVVANLRRVLFVDEPPRNAALRAYSGRGDLRSYLRVMATRDLIRIVNRGRRDVSTDDDALLDRLVPAQDAELSFLRAQYRDVVDDAMRTAVEKLDERGRALLRYSLVLGWTVDQVGQVYGVHRSTAARWIAAVRDGIGETIRRELAERLKLETDEVDSIIRLVQSRVDVSLDRALK